MAPALLSAAPASGVPAAVPTVGSPAAALQADAEDPNLDQTVDAGQELVHDRRTLASGHVDMGPKLIDGQWTFLIHDDAAKADASATSVWRSPDETVLHVTDQAIMTVPDDPAYDFLGAAAGESVWVVPQTQNPDVVWLGWNTQDPSVLAMIDRGMTLSLTGTEGPGVVTVYLQSGSFGEPELAFDSRVDGPQPVWVDVNTHTHANWVFTAPGVYLMRLTAQAGLIDGSEVTDTQVVRFAVGSATPPAQAHDAVWPASADGEGPASAGSEAGDGEAVAGTAGGSAGVMDQGAAGGADGQGSAGRAGGIVPPDAEADGAGGALEPVLIGVIAALAAVLAGVATVVARGNRAKRRALAGTELVGKLAGRRGGDGRGREGRGGGSDDHSDRQGVGKGGGQGADHGGRPGDSKRGDR
ncbi:MAG: choice-of-anchor M domain-containing protein [Bifidobacteriaceae bacterium]|nr:choice-of-anchor M domain-containing protein [Bifidobacteriaceae bacterium]